MLHKPRPAASSSLRRSGSSGCKQLEKVAGWVGTGLYTAFFTSLDRCSCVKLDTIEMQEPMMLRLRRADQPLLPSSTSSASAKPRHHHSSKLTSLPSPSHHKLPSPDHQDCLSSPPSRN